MPQLCLPVTERVLFKNVNIFDGYSPELAQGMDVLVEGNKIAKISDTSTSSEDDDVTVVNGDGRVLMPGLIDVHWHSLMANVSMAKLLSEDFGYLAIAGAQGAGETLMRGFTTVRDMGGNSFGLKRATDEGLIAGPRIYPSGAFISQTSGHFDFRGPHDVPASPADPLSYHERVGMTMIADGVPEVLKRVREQLRAGATQIKLAAGGGVSSAYDPIDVAEYTFEEIKAAVDAAKAWNTYVAVHVFTDEGTQRAINAGVLSIEHANLCSEETFKLMAEKDVWYSMQPLLNDEDSIPFPPGSDSQRKHEIVTDGTSKAIELAKKYGVKTAFGTDVLFAKELAHKQGKLLSKLKRWYTPHEILKMATSDNAKLCKLCGPRDPYPGGLGVIKEGALADLILVDGNPLEDIDLVTHPDNKFVTIMKNGVIYKNILD